MVHSGLVCEEHAGPHVCRRDQREGPRYFELSSTSACSLSVLGIGPLCWFEEEEFICKHDHEELSPLTNEADSLHQGGNICL